MRKLIALTGCALVLAACGPSTQTDTEEIKEVSYTKFELISPTEDRLQVSLEASRSIERTAIPKNGPEIIQDVLDERQAERQAAKQAARQAARQEARQAARQAQPDPEPAAPAPQPQSDGLNWPALRNCESGSNYQLNTGNGYYGAYQFSLSTWHAVGGSGYPHEASPGEQDYRAQVLLRTSGDEQWPVCGDLLYT